jgi:hypothetical protein
LLRLFGDGSDSNGRCSHYSKNWQFPGHDDLTPSKLMEQCG